MIALLKGKCLNHLNYSGSYNCCTRLLGKEVYIRSVGASNGTRTRAVCMASRNTNRLYYTCMVSPAPERVQRSLVWPRRRVEAKTGIEPATCWLQISCTASCATWPFYNKEACEKRLTFYALSVSYSPGRPSTTSLFMDPVTGIGPVSSAWKADILPLNYTELFEIYLSSFV